MGHGRATCDLAFGSQAVDESRRLHRRSRSPQRNRRAEPGGTPTPISPAEASCRCHLFPRRHSEGGLSRSAAHAALPAAEPASRPPPCEQPRPWRHSGVLHRRRLRHLHPLHPRLLRHPRGCSLAAAAARRRRRRRRRGKGRSKRSHAPMVATRWTFPHAGATSRGDALDLPPTTTRAHRQRRPRPVVG